MTNVRVLVLIGVMAGAPGCGASGSDDATEAPVDQAAIDEGIAKVTAALGEATCATTAADAIGEYNRGGAMSPLAATYDHPTCRDAFVVDFPAVPAGGSFTAATNEGSMFDPIGCLFSYAYISVWKKDPAGPTALGEAVGTGGWVPVFTRGGPFCNRSATVQAPAAGDYKVVASSGQLFGAKKWVTVQWN
jgi:hypothetical protein